MGEPAAWDMVVRNAKVFDGSGADGRVLDVAVRDGFVAAMGANLPAADVPNVRDLRGRWLIPGLLDIHTHEDLEAELDPGLPEVVRHGTTSVIVGNCSIGLAFGAQRINGQDPIVDCFARVENIPKSVLRKTAEKATWETPGDYLNHLDQLPLSVNIAPFLPHSMLRIEVMGLEDSITRDPTKAELDRMVGILDEAMQHGYLGMSTDGLPLHFLANRPNVKKRIPTQYAPFHEYKALAEVLRKHGRVWQMTPATDDGKLTLKLFGLTSGRLYGAPLKVTALAALDSVNNRQTKAQALLFANLLNSSLVNGNFRMQALSAPFRIYSEGVVSPLAEANPLLRRLIETELDDVEARRTILDDPDFVEEFREMWARGKSGFGVRQLRRRLRLENEFLTRDLNDMEVYRSPVDAWQGRTLASVYRRYRSWVAGQPCESPDETAAFESLGANVRDDGEFFLALLRHFDRELYWSYVSANKDANVTKELLFHPKLLPGFNDSGAHVTNMAFYDGNLRALKIALNDSEARFSQMVGRLTREPAEFFGLDVGSIEIGKRADLTVLDPEALRRYDGEESIRYIYRELFGCHQLVNRSDGVVTNVFVKGEEVWRDAEFASPHGKERLGQALRVSG